MRIVKKERLVDHAAQPRQESNQRLKRKRHGVNSSGDKRDVKKGRRKDVSKGSNSPCRGAKLKESFYMIGVTHRRGGEEGGM